ncbi:MAG TPA: VCBS repeat-containing protein, partial [Puia sp.]|nr:VCBS repeat-containing protein [Puia sp.]
SRDDMLRQINVLRKKFPDYKSYAVATMDVVLAPEERKGALVVAATDLRSCLLRNEGGGRFTLMALPMQAQLSSINGMLAEDVDGDGQLDVVMSGNDYGTEPSVGRYDAFNGLVLRGDGKGGFQPLSILQSGLYLPGNQKSLVKLRGAGGSCLVAAGQNRGPLQILKLKKEVRMIPLEAADVSARITYRDGSVRLEECVYGSSFMSQSGRFINVTGPVVSVEIKDGAGKVRKISI